LSGNRPDFNKKKEVNGGTRRKRKKKNGTGGESMREGDEKIRAVFTAQVKGGK
jgi:hypothetical protein